MKVCCVSLLLLLVAGCGSQLLKHETKPISIDEAHAVIDRVFMEQPTAYRPESIEFKAEYLEIHSGIVTNGKSQGVGVAVAPGVVVGGDSTQQTSKAISTRLYYTSIGTVTPYKRRRHYMVIIRSKDGVAPYHVFMSNEDKAHRFTDAMRAIAK